MNDAKALDLALSLALTIGVVLISVLFGTLSGASGSTFTAAPVPDAYHATQPEPASVPVDDGPGATSVTRVIDGDTFVIDTGETVRVLGIDSCEIATPGGPEAKDSAEALLTVGSITLRSEPGVDKDRYGRALRYVDTLTGDFGESMVGYSHTGVYAGRNDADSAYVARLRELDYDGRSCAGAPAVSDSVYVPVPNGGDDDGESRFCSRRKWC